jgi:hypothetical protein
MPDDELTSVNSLWQVYIKKALDKPETLARVQ